MPAPQRVVLAELAKANFIAKDIKIPTDWSFPGDQYPKAFSWRELFYLPNPPSNLFGEATLNKYHVEAAKTIGEAFAKFIEGVCGAICDAIDKWMKLTTISGVIINGPVGILTPGGVKGPPLAPLIMASAPKEKPQELKYSQAIANALGNLWQIWHLGLSGTIMYPPTFAACPSPVHPPTPNLPLPLIALSSPGESGLSPATLKSTMESNLGDPQALHAAALFEAISKAFNTVFQIFKASTLIQNVLGTGPVPTYAPPFVPVGPVVGGVGNSPPGCLV